MERRALGRTGIDVSLIGLGTVKLGRTEGVKYPARFALPDRRAAAALLARARDLGINLLDTAPAYGASEARLGGLIADTRRDWILCTKVGEEIEGGISRFDFTPEHVEVSVTRSLERLGTDYLDIVLIHAGDDDLAPIDRLGTLDALAAEQSAGRVLAVGISHKTIAGGLAAAQRCDVIMTELSTADSSRLPVIDAARRHGCGVLAKKVLASGHLEDTAESLRFAAGQHGVSSIVVGTIDHEHLAANARAVAGS